MRQVNLGSVNVQPTLFEEAALVEYSKINNVVPLTKKYDDRFHPFPSTRYQGSKMKIANWIWNNISHISFSTALDAFGGTGCVSHLLKTKGKLVHYNDILPFNTIIGKALIENSSTTLDNADLEFILTKRAEVIYPTFIRDTFQNIFYLDEENDWLDMIIKNINDVENEYKRALAWFALFQSCIIKRPYNLFHRANLYVRTSEVTRSFGNKVTWDKSFAEHFVVFVQQANMAVFNNNRPCLSLNYDAMKIPDCKYDLVYIDTPYINSEGTGTDYSDFYHFLNGMLDYDQWNVRINKKYKHMPLVGDKDNLWINKNRIYAAFEELISKYRNSVLVISYREDGTPSVPEILDLLKKYKSNVQEVCSRDYKYVLSQKKSAEVLFIAK